MPDKKYEPDAQLDVDRLQRLYADQLKYPVAHDYLQGRADEYIAQNAVSVRDVAAAKCLAGVAA